MAKPSMATIFNSINTPIKQEPHHSPPQPQPPPQQQPPPLIVKPEPQDLPIVVQEQQQQPPPPQEPQFLKSVTELGNLSTAIDAFKRRFDELQNHLNFIDNAITTRSNELMERQKTQQQQQQQTAAEKPASIATPSEIVVTQQLPSQSQTDTTKQVKEAAPPTATAGEGKSEIRSLCEMMCGKGLRKYIISNLSNADKLREELPVALKCSPKPATLVLDCIGRFYLQGRKAYEKKSPMIAGRQASILVLEAFLLISDGQNAMEATVKEEAERAAVAWRRRLITEGGVRKSGEIDAKGLLFFIGGFGIPRLFSNEDVFDLVKLSNLKQLADVVRKSRVLVTKVSDILEGMMKKGMKVEAVDVACIFGIEDKFPAPKLLTSFLQESKEPLKGKRREADNSPVVLKEAKERQLVALRSVVKFLEERQLDPTELLPGWQFKEKIIELEKDVADLNKKINKQPLSKRPADKSDLSNYWKGQETKRARVTEKGSPLIPSPGIGLQDQRSASYVDGQISYNTMIQLDGGFSGPVNSYPAGTSVPYGSSTGPILGTAATNGASLSVAYGGSAGVHREMVVDGTGQLIGAWRAGDTSFNDRSMGQSIARHPASGLFGSSLSIEGFVGLPNSSSNVAANRTSTSDLYGFVDNPTVAANRSAASDLYGFADAPTVTANHSAASNLYGFVDASTATAKQNAASDLYGFADAVAEGAYSSTRHTGPLPPVVGSRHSSYMY